MTVARGAPSRAGLATAAALTMQLVLLRLVLDADEKRAFFLGHPIGVGCKMRETTGIPCPMCGVTRALGLTLHGEFARAFRLFPMAPAVCAGLVAVSVALVAAFALASRGNDALGGVFERRLRQGSLVYGGFCGALWLTDYASRVGSLFWRG